MTAPAQDILHKSQPATGHLMQAKHDGSQLQNLILASPEQPRAASIVRGTSRQPALTVNGTTWLPPPSALGASSPLGMGAAEFARQRSRLGGGLPTLLPPAASSSPVTSGHALQPGPLQQHLSATRHHQQQHRQEPHDGSQSLSAAVCGIHATAPTAGGAPMAALASAAPASAAYSTPPCWPLEQPSQQPSQSWSSMLQQHQRPHPTPPLQQQQLHSQHLQQHWAAVHSSGLVPAHPSSNALLLPSDAAGAVQNPFKLAKGAPMPPLRLAPAANGPTVVNAMLTTSQQLGTSPGSTGDDDWRPQKRSRVAASARGPIRQSGGRCNGAGSGTRQHAPAAAEAAPRQPHPGQPSAPSLRDRSGLAVPRRITDGHHHEARSGSTGSEPAATAMLSAGVGMGNGISAQQSEAVATAFAKAATPASGRLSGSDVDVPRPARLGSGGSGSGGLAASDAPDRPSTPWQLALSRQRNEQAPGQHAAAADHAAEGGAAVPDARTEVQQQGPSAQPQQLPTAQLLALSPLASALVSAPGAADAKVDSPPPPPWATEVLTPQTSGHTSAASLPKPASPAAAEALVQHADPAQQSAEQYGTDSTGVDSKPVVAEATRAEVIWGRVKGYPFWPVRLHAVHCLKLLRTLEAVISLRAFMQRICNGAKIKQCAAECPAVVHIRCARSCRHKC